MDKGRKSERQIVAWTIATLLDAHDLEPSPKAIVRYAHDAGVTVPEIHAEWKALEASRWSPVDQAAADTPTLPAPPMMGGGRDGRIPRRYKDNMRRNADGDLERRCSRCREWKPADGDHFRVVNRSTGALKSMCHPCLGEYQQERYLSVKAHQSLGEVGLAFVVADGDPALVCKGCGGELGVGDSAEVDGVVYHEACHP
jgi:hypothetical protein